MRAKIDLFGAGKDEKKVIHYSELRTPLEAREEDIFKPKEGVAPTGPAGQIEPIGSIGPMGPIGPIGSNEKTETPPIESVPVSIEPPSAPVENPSPAPLTPPSAKKSPWTFKWFGSQAPARDEQKSVPESVVVDNTSFQEKAEETKKEERVPVGPVDPIGQIGPIGPMDPVADNEPKTPTIEGNVVDLSRLKK